MANKKLKVCIITDNVRHPEEVAKDALIAISEVVADIVGSRDYVEVLDCLRNVSLEYVDEYCRETSCKLLANMLQLKVTKSDDINKTLETLMKCKNALLIVDNQSNLMEIVELCKKYQNGQHHLRYDYSQEKDLYVRV